MIAADTNIWIYFFNGENDPYVDVFDHALDDANVAMPPPVVSELLSFPSMTDEQSYLIRKTFLLKPDHSFWERAGLLRAKMFQKGFKPKLPDTLIAQSCIDHDVPLLTRDDGFEMFLEFGGLRLVDVRG